MLKWKRVQFLTHYVERRQAAANPQTKPNALGRSLAMALPL